MTPIERLLAMIERARDWPCDVERAVRQLIARWSAFGESDEDRLRRLANWPSDRLYVVDNLPEKIKSAYADLLFGEDPVFRAAQDGDQPRLDQTVAGLPAALHGAEETCVSEGEVWWRLSADPAARAAAIVTWHSRADVVPLLAGRDPAAVAFVSLLGPAAPGEDPPGSAHPGRVAWRHLEVHADGTVENYLYRGTWARLGERVGLDRHPETADLADAWDHYLPMLAGRIVNRWGRRPLAGVSEYAGIWTQFLVLNEATSIGRENMRLTAKKRAVVPASAVRPRPGELGAGGIPAANGPGADPERVNRPTFDAGEDVLVHDPLDIDEGSGGGAPFKILEYSFDAEALIAYKRDLVETILTRCDIVPQFVGGGDFGVGASGTALRVRLLPTTNAAEGKARAWDDALPEIIRRAQLLEALPQPQGGLGIPWAAPADAPAVQRTDPLPQDDDDIARRHATLKTAGLLSVRESVRERNPEWNDEQVAGEVERIRADEASNLPRALTFGA